jgi:glycerol uptake facilitator-like aquaporin
MSRLTARLRQPPPASEPAAPGRGLHGHGLHDSLLRAAAAAALGTLVLVLAITATAVAASLARPIAGAPYGSLAVPAAGGLALAALAAALGPLSGAHLNPAVTLGLAEAVVTFLLVLVITAVASDRRVPAGVAAVAIGAALAAAILISGPVSGAGVNPARALGPMILAGKFTDWWAYLAAPLVAGVLAVLAYDQLLRPGASSAAAPTAVPAGPSPVPVPRKARSRAGQPSPTDRASPSA